MSTFLVYNLQKTFFSNIVKNNIKVQFTVHVIFFVVPVFIITAVGFSDNIYAGAQSELHLYKGSTYGIRREIENYGAFFQSIVHSLYPSVGSRKLLSLCAVPLFSNNVQSVSLIAIQPWYASPNHSSPTQHSQILAWSWRGIGRICQRSSHSSVAEYNQRKELRCTIQTLICIQGRNKERKNAHPRALSEKNKNEDREYFDLNFHIQLFGDHFGTPTTLCYQKIKVQTSPQQMRTLTPIRALCVQTFSFFWSEYLGFLPLGSGCELIQVTLRHSFGICQSAIRMM